MHETRRVRSGTRSLRPPRVLLPVLAAASLALTTAVGLPFDGGLAAQVSSEEVRALWVLRTSLISPQSINTMVRAAREHGFNTLLVQVRGRGDAWFAGGLEPRAADLQRQPQSFDPLATVLEAARDAGLRLHAWVNVNLVSSAVDLPAARTHLIHRHPEWLMVPRDIAQDLAKAGPQSPAYVGRLARWTRAQSDVEGLYASPVTAGAAAHVEGVVRDLARRYALDGIHLDYARYPSSRFDYSRTAIGEFKAAVRARLTPAVRRELDRKETDDLFAYPDALPADWTAFRLERMTGLVTRLRTAIKAERPDALFTVATAPDAQEARAHKMQDWPRWLETRVVDAVAPMAYTPEPARFAEQIAAARAVAGGSVVWAGIGAYRLSPGQTIENIRTARRLGTAGFVLFSYDSLTDSRQPIADYLGLVGRSAFARPAGTEGSR
ncbi:MAG TPA: family 10 glycosylhydrolase [Vicinamibacterales bacterium]|nr:family 10 glycosylhydrolase [Vicinamibacterales bacterium]